MWLGKTHENTQNSYIQHMNIYPQLIMIAYLDEAIKILHNIPEEYRIGFLDATGGLCKINKQVIVTLKLLFC